MLNRADRLIDLLPSGPTDVLLVGPGCEALRNALVGQPRIHFEYFDGIDPKSGKIFDVVVCGQLVTVPLDVLAVLRERLRPGGRLLAIESNADHPRATANSLSIAVAIRKLLDAGWSPDIPEVVTSADPLLADSVMASIETFSIVAEPLIEMNGPTEPVTISVHARDLANLDCFQMSPDLTGNHGHEVIVRVGGDIWSAHAEALETARNRLVICLSGDVYLPRGWMARLQSDWRRGGEEFGPLGVAGIHGVMSNGRAVGHLITGRMRRRLGESRPTRVTALDDMVLVVARESGLRFDTDLGSIGHGTDLALQAKARGLGAIVIDAPCHVPEPLRSVGRPARLAGQMLAHKWAVALPVATPWGRLERSGFVGLPREPLASIIILCCDGVDLNRLCLESVARNSPSEIELIVVDNGSTDGTREFLHEFAQKSPLNRVTIIRNEVNRGFPSGVNQGLEVALSEWVVLLNNDTVVTPNWLGGLILLAEEIGETAGLVGAVTNSAPDPQRVQPEYSDLGGLDEFAAARRIAFAGRRLDVSRISGFCLLIRRAVLDQIGNLDEGFGLGFFEDDDLGVRARAAGFRLLVALDVYIHHFGSQTVQALGLDAERLLRENFERFRTKWGDGEAEKYHLPAEPIARPRVSLTMIVRNEENHLTDCLKSVRDLVDEIVVVDTGSTDATVAIARSFGARVSHFAWVDHFAAARNAALERATGTWAFWMDADDRLESTDRERLRRLLADLPSGNVAYVMKCVCVAASGSPTVVDHVRLFRRDPRVRWTYRVHEQILPSLRSAGADVRWSDVSITHVGYAEPSSRGPKLARDLRLLQLEEAEQPGDPFTLFNLGSVYQELGRPIDALAALKQSLVRSHPRDSIVRKLYALIARGHNELGDRPSARAACDDGLRHYPQDAELLFLDGLLKRDSGDRAGAEASWERLLAPAEGDHFASVDAGLRGHKTRHNLAALAMETGRIERARELWEAALVDSPGYWPAAVGLGELAVGQRDWQRADHWTSYLDRLGGEATLEACILRTRALMDRDEFAMAREYLSKEIPHRPNDVRLRQLMSHAWLKEGHDPVEAEAALRAVLAIEPEHREAAHNLEVLLNKRG